VAKADHRILAFQHDMGSPLWAENDSLIGAVGFALTGTNDVEPKMSVTASESKDVKTDGLGSYSKITVEPDGGEIVFDFGPARHATNLSGFMTT
jgi:hypothetical protein